MNSEDVKVFLKAMNFAPVTGALDIWRKDYISHDYAISVVFADEISKTTINYGESIICGRKTTCNFSQPESVVVLECVNRLLEKGYHPSSIELEKSWKVGGYLDKYVEIKELTDMISFSDTDFCAAIYVVPFINPFDSTGVPMKSLQNYIDEGNIEILDSMRKPVKKSKRRNGDIPYYGANGIAGMIDDYISFY